MKNVGGDGKISNGRRRKPTDKGKERWDVVGVLLRNSNFTKDHPGSGVQGSSRVGI